MWYVIVWNNEILLWNYILPLNHRHHQRLLNFSPINKRKTHIHSVELKYFNCKKVIWTLVNYWSWLMANIEQIGMNSRKIKPGLVGPICCRSGEDVEWCVAWCVSWLSSRSLSCRLPAPVTSQFCRALTLGLNSVGELVRLSLLAAPARPGPPPNISYLKFFIYNKIVSFGWWINFLIKAYIAVQILSTVRLRESKRRTDGSQTGSKGE